MKSTRISVRLDRKLRACIQRRAKTTGKNEGEVIREALEKEFQEKPQQQSCYDLAQALGLVGSIPNAPRDLSYSPEHMKGFGEL